MRMYSIGFIVPYFGKLPNTIEFWLRSCKENPSIDWFLFTDDKTIYEYPDNVHVTYMSFSDLIRKMQSFYSFPLGLQSPKKLCDFKVAYGEIFSDILKDYDFWGYCDLDIVWGNLRHFYTDEILSTYDKIGFTGNCMIYRNNPQINTMYRRQNHLGKVLYKDYFSDDIMHCFDEVGISDIFLYHKVPCFHKTVFSNLASMRPDLYTCFLPKSTNYKNKNAIYYWDYGTLSLVYRKRNQIYFEEMQFIHFLGSRNFDILVKSEEDRFLIVPNAFVPYQELDASRLKNYYKGCWIGYMKQHFHRGDFRLFLKTFLRFNYWYIFHNDIFNYWVWTQYDENKKDRVRIL